MTGNPSKAVKHIMSGINNILTDLRKDDVLWGKLLINVLCVVNILIGNW